MSMLKTIKAHLDRNRIGELLVQRRHLSPADLRAALALQRSERRRTLGQILIDEGYVTRGQVQRILALQYTMRATAAGLTLLMAAMTFDPRTAQAAGLKDIPSQITLTEVSVSSISAYPQLFGSGEKRSGDLSAFTKWSDMFDRFESDARNGNGAAVLASWKANLESMRGLPIDEMASRVNDMANKVRYISDSKNWGKSDYWETPVEFFTRGGDCEDFAITKYTSLRALGVPDDRMRIAIVKDLEKNVPHAVLIVYGDRGTYVLDNQIKQMRSQDSISHYKPIFSINRTAWWLHTPTRNTMVASAAGN